MKTKLRIWVVSVSCPDPKDNYTERIKASSKEEAEGMVASKLIEGRSIAGSRPARKSKFDT